MTAKPKDFVVHGPLKVDLIVERAGRLVDEDMIRQRWKTDDTWKEAAGKSGCYVFAFRAAKGWKPVYVGRATKTFRQECFDNHKIKKLQRALAQQAKGTLNLFLIAGSKNKNLLDHMETMLIGYAYEKNSLIQNDRKKPAPLWSIQGVIGSSRRPTNNEMCLKQALGIS